MFRNKIIALVLLHITFLVLEHVYYRWCISWFFGIHAHVNPVCKSINLISRNISGIANNAMLLGTSYVVERLLGILNFGNREQ